MGIGNENRLKLGGRHADAVCDHMVKVTAKFSHIRGLCVLIIVNRMIGKENAA